MNLDDERLLDLLGHALLAEGHEPPPERVAALHDAVTERYASPRLVSLRRRHRLAQRAGPFVLAGGLVVGAATAAAAATGNLPRPVRALAHEVGLPVDSPALVDARDAAADLQRALARDDVAAVRHGASDLRDKLRALERDERDQIDERARDLLDRVDALDPEPSPAEAPDVTEPDVTEPDTPTTTPLPDTTPVTDPPVTDATTVPVG